MFFEILPGSSIQQIHQPRVARLVETVDSFANEQMNIQLSAPVSYTHLDVYKRQGCTVRPGVEGIRVAKDRSYSTASARRRTLNSAAGSVDIRACK